MSLQASEAAAKVNAVEHIELPQTTDGILRLVRQVLARPNIQSIELHVGAPVTVRWLRGLFDAPLLDKEPGLDEDNLLAAVPVHTLSVGGDAEEVLMRALIAHASAGRYASFLFVGSLRYVKASLNIPDAVALRAVAGTPFVNVAGIRTLEIPSFPEECVVLFGSEKEWATLAEVAGDTSSLGYTLLL